MILSKIMAQDFSFNLLCSLFFNAIEKVIIETKKNFNSLIQRPMVDGAGKFVLNLCMRKIL